MPVADSTLRAGADRNIPVVSADIYSRFLDPRDFAHRHDGIPIRWRGRAWLVACELDVTAIDAFDHKGKSASYCDRSG